MEQIRCKRRKVWMQVGKNKYVSGASCSQLFMYHTVHKISIKSEMVVEQVTVPIRETEKDRDRQKYKQKQKQTKEKETIIETEKM